MIMLVFDFHDHLDLDTDSTEVFPFLRSRAGLSMSSCYRVACINRGDESPKPSPPKPSPFGAPDSTPLLAKRVMTPILARLGLTGRIAFPISRQDSTRRSNTGFGESVIDEIIFSRNITNALPMIPIASALFINDNCPSLRSSPIICAEENFLIRSIPCPL